MSLTHFWTLDSRFTFCGLSVVGQILSSSPECNECSRIIAENAAYEPAPTDRRFRMELAASSLAPYLQRACDEVRGLAGRQWVNLSPPERALWLATADAVLQVLTEAPHNVPAPDYFRLTAEAARKQFAVMKGGKQ